MTETTTTTTAPAAFTTVYGETDREYIVGRLTETGLDIREAVAFHVRENNRVCGSGLVQRDVDEIVAWFEAPRPPKAPTKVGFWYKRALAAQG